MSFVVNPVLIDIELYRIRARRDELLTATDWTVLPDSPLSESDVHEWKVYRQTLRDIPQDLISNPEKITPLFLFPKSPNDAILHRLQRYIEKD